VNQRSVIYDLETYPNIFTAAFFCTDTSLGYLFEISDRANQLPALFNFLNHLQNANTILVGYNNLAFDYPIIHAILDTGYETTYDRIYEFAQEIIDTDYNERFKHTIRRPLIKQLDLMKIHHFDNVSKATSLKTLEINMRMDSVEDLPFPPGSVLSDQQKDILIKYNWHDIHATWEFWGQSTKEIKLRQRLSIVYGMDFTNHSNTKIGSDLCTMKLQDSGIACYESIDGYKTKRQTIRESIPLADCIFDYIYLEHSEFKRIKAYLSQQIVTETKGVFNNLTASVNGIDYIVGTGGLHGSVDNQTLYSDDDYVIVDVDAKAFYPSIAIHNKVYPEHLGIGFCETLDNLIKERATYPKGSPESSGLKEAGNATYGNSGNPYSIFYDLKYLLTTTINGQLLLFMLIEQLIKTPGLSMIQANTDGVTYRVPRQHLSYTRDICRWWERVTGLVLEEAFYSRMFILNVNSYIAEYEDGTLKRKNKFAYGNDLQWHQNHSMQIVAKACEAVLIDDQDLAEFIYNHADLLDFTLQTKVPRNSHLETSSGQQLGNIVRYVITTDGYQLTKVSPPTGEPGAYKRANKLTDVYFNQIMAEIGPGIWDERIHTNNKSVYRTRRIGINAGHNVTICNHIEQLTTAAIDYEFYISEAEKLLNPLYTNQNKDIVIS
jgi:hypothetical protein